MTDAMASAKLMAREITLVWSLLLLSLLSRIWPKAAANSVEAVLAFSIMESVYSGVVFWFPASVGDSSSYIPSFTFWIHVCRMLSVVWHRNRKDTSLLAQL